MANGYELLRNLVTINKPKMLTGLSQKACDRLLDPVCEHRNI
jgi:hypothetical protein